MKRKSIESSYLLSVGYDEANNILEIEFHDGLVLPYYNVPQEEYRGLILAESHGKYYINFIRGKYPHQPIP